jgi:hypothetical protein
LSESQSTMMSEHLSQSQLAGYSGRTLDTAELLAVDGHLASCDVCHKRLTGILPGVAKLAHGSSFQFGEGPFHLDYDQHLEPYVDGKANGIDREIVDSHVALCSRCADELRDLLAFKQQPVAAMTVGTQRSPRWKEWFSHWPLMSNPALATAVVIAILVLTMAVVLWTRYPASGRNEQAKGGARAPDKQNHEQPSPAPTEQTAETNPPSNEENGAALPAPLNEKPLVVLNDAGGHVIVDQRGRLEGLHELPPDLRESVEQALATRTLRASPALTGWRTGAGDLRSGLETRSTFAPLGPTDVVLETDRPTFRWRALDGATDYTVTVYDASLLQVAASGPVTGTQWTTPNSLARGVTYSWQISALKDGKRVVSPKPPLREARFRILDQPAAVALARLKESVGSSHLAMGVFYWKHGLIEQSEREFQALAKANPNSAAVKELLASIRSRRRR